MIFSKRKICNAINKQVPSNNYNYQLSNIIINGDKRGCSGIIGNPNKGTYVYVTTEKHGCCWLKRFMFRRAASMKDYVGDVNQWVDDFDVLIKEIINLLENRS